MSPASIPSVLLEADAHFVATYPVNRLPRDFPAGILRLNGMVRRLCSPLGEV
jgi:hypothetical protein